MSGAFLAGPVDKDLARSLSMEIPHIRVAEKRPHVQKGACMHALQEAEALLALSAEGFAEVSLALGNATPATMKAQSARLDVLAQKIAPLAAQYRHNALRCRRGFVADRTLKDVQ